MKLIGGSLPGDQLVKSIDIEFKAECNYGDTIKVGTGPLKTNNVQSDILIEGDGSILATASIELF
jgi:acyl-CoA thioesterase FadM